MAITAPAPTRLLTVDDALAAAEALWEFSAGHEQAGEAILISERLEDLTTDELETLCALFGVQAV